jgi:Na+/H+-dicarboxylate symporter
MGLRTMSSSTKILVGLVAGAFVGLFLGEHVSMLKIAADGFVKLLQMTVLVMFCAHFYIRHPVRVSRNRDRVVLQHDSRRAARAV